MCTRVLWQDAGDAVVVGRNMDFAHDLLTNLWKMPRGVRRDDGVTGKLSWESKYGSVIAAGYDIASTDGLNEKGLAGHLLWLAESEYGDRDDERVQLSQAVWLQYFLDNFATVADAVRWVRDNDVQVVPLADPTGGKQPALHVALEDATGDSAIIEYMGGKAQIYHSREYTVMTNSPTYDQQLELVKKFEGLGGDAPLPGTTDARDRFARASYYLGRLDRPSTQLEALAAMMSVMRNAAQPFRVADPGKPEASQTLWQTVTDLTNLRYVFESTTRPNIVWVDLAKLDFSAGQRQAKLDLVGRLALEGGLSGEVSDQFEDTDGMTFLSVALEEQLIAAAAKQRAAQDRLEAQVG